MSKRDFSGLLWIVVCYTLAFAGAFFTIYFLDLDNIVLKTFLADVVATGIVFLFSSVFKNASFYDPYWSVAPVPIAIYWKLYFKGGTWTSLEIAVLLVIIVWALRLTLNWYRGWQGLQHEDWRYTDLRAKTGKLFPAVNFLGIHLFPTVMVFLGCLPLLAVFTSTAMNESGFLVSPGLYFLIGVLLGLAAPVIQFFADEQMREHRRSPQRSYIDTGLWRYSRHPNYFGEILFWFALMLIGLAFRSFEWWMASGFVAMTVMFVFISIPMMEKRIAGKYPSYAEYKKHVAILVPWRRRVKA